VRIEVRLLGWLREYLRADLERFDEKTLELAEGTSVGALADALGFRGETDFLAMLNGERVPPELLDDTTLAEQDTVIFLPPIKGG
jgi:sulfur carrier protein ThiS